MNPRYLAYIVLLERFVFIYEYIYCVSVQRFDLCLLVSIGDQKNGGEHGDQRPEVKSSIAGVICKYELPSVDVGNQTGVL